MSYIEVKDLTKQYSSFSKPFLALRGLNLDIEEFEVCSIMGPSGCGKSTLLNILGGIDEPTSGFARIGDYTITTRDLMKYSFNSKYHANYRRYDVGIVFQLHNLSPIHTAIENIELPMIFAGVQREKRRKKASELLEAVNLTERATHKPDQLSGGERQRIALAIAFANDPKIILADEPTGELDFENTKMICDLFLNLKEIRDYTLILVTHNPVVAKIGDNIYNMKDGKISGTIPKKIVNEMSKLSSLNNEQHEFSYSDTGSTISFPPIYCSECGSQNITIPTSKSKSGIWLESDNEKRFNYEFEFAQCGKCNKIYWNTKNINTSN